MAIPTLKPCPLCGGEAQVLQIVYGQAQLDATIRCNRCGLELDWRTPFVVVPPIHVGIDEHLRIKQIGLDPFEAWNRRTGEKEG